MVTYPIGEFARLARVSITTLRHYDETGLFAAAVVEPVTGYRRYTADQLPLLNKILALRRLGLGLATIAELVDPRVPGNRVEAVLRSRRAELEEEISTASARLAEVDIRLRSITQEFSMTVPDILVKTVPDLVLVGARDVITEPGRIRERCIALDAAARRAVTVTGLRIVGPSFALYVPSELGVDVEMGYPVSGGPEDLPDEAPAPGAGALHRILRGAAVGYAVHSGSYDDFAAVGRLHVQLREWLGEHGYEVGWPVRELYLRPPGRLGTGAAGVMELQYPLTSAAPTS